MSIRERIMAVGNPYVGGHGQDLFEHGKKKCADLAEARERELLAQRDELLAVLREAELVLAEKLRRLGADPNVSPTTHRIRAAIAKVEGGATAHKKDKENKL